MAVALPSTWNSRIVPCVMSFVFAVRASAIFSALQAISESRKTKNLTPCLLWSFASLPRYFLLRIHRLHHHHALLEILHHIRLQAYIRGTLCQSHLINLVLKLHQSEEESFRHMWAPQNVHTH